MTSNRPHAARYAAAALIVVSLGGCGVTSPSSLTLAAGTYTVEASATSAVEGRAALLDDHAITVR